MLHNKFDIIINDSFTLEDFTKLLKDFSKDKKLVFGITEYLDFFVDDYHDYDVESFILKIKQNFFERFIISNKEINRLKNETTMNLDFSNDTFYIVKNIDEIEKFIKLDHFSFTALIVEKNIVTHVFFYTEHMDDMIIVVDCKPESDFKSFLDEYSKKHKKM
ncbi:hypothetical protein [Tepidibacter formicigenes]|jgi:hypothetical protein|uniref:Uncharacterized protein n=1 Tax=Tepidibacter formicigenes DSM 15518 TaxID=1123349 RepID=A0A1M6PSM1_9FIRM|nr:hypothetical protein [Tepidibacter formicigenes]SHK10888.1 hypothetical protein SAMN02744037_01637 [Tepidibacter formicigenes DSM 15518]